MSERPHRRLEIWKKSIELVKQIYQMTKQFPREEQFVLVPQMRRAAISVPSNIAEGAARAFNREKLQFFHIGRASLSELDTQIEICEVLGLIQVGEKERVGRLMDEIGRMMTGLIASRRYKDFPQSLTR